MMEVILMLLSFLMVMTLGKADGVSHFTATRGKVKNWQCVTPTSGKKTEIGQYKGYKKGVVTAVELFQQIEK